MNQHALKTQKVDNYIYVTLVDPFSGEPHDLLFSRNQWEVAHERAIKRISTLPFSSPIAAWKVWILRLLGFHFI
jgi:hypothetical protein